MATVSRVNNIMHGIAVQYRRSGEQQPREKEFIGPTAGEDSSRFVSKYVAGLTQEQFAELPSKEKQLYEIRTITGRADQQSVQLYCRKINAWNWHVCLPFQYDANEQRVK